MPDILKIENGDIVSCDKNTLNVVFIELPKIKKLEKSIDTNSKLENWALFLMDADNPKKQDFIQNLTSKEDGLMQAKKSLSNISKNKELWIAQWKQEAFDRDIRSGLNAALNKGIQQGILQERISVIRAMLASGKIPVQEIASILQIPVEEVQKLI